MNKNKINKVKKIISLATFFYLYFSNSGMYKIYCNEIKRALFLLSCIMFVFSIVKE